MHAFAFIESIIYLTCYITGDNSSTNFIFIYNNFLNKSVVLQVMST